MYLRPRKFFRNQILLDYLGQWRNQSCQIFVQSVHSGVFDKGSNFAICSVNRGWPLHYNCCTTVQLWYIHVFWLADSVNLILGYSTIQATDGWLAIMVFVWDWSARYCFAHTAGSDRRFSTNWLSGFGLISDGMVGALYFPWRLGQCTWVLKISVLETGHTRYCSISGSDPLRQSYRLCHGYCR